MILSKSLKPSLVCYSPLFTDNKPSCADRARCIWHQKQNTNYGSNFVSNPFWPASFIPWELNIF